VSITLSQKHFRSGDNYKKVRNSQAVQHTRWRTPGVTVTSAN